MLRVVNDYQAVIQVYLDSPNGEVFLKRFDAMKTDSVGLQGVSVGSRIRLKARSLERPPQEWEFDVVATEEPLQLRFGRSCGDRTSVSARSRGKARTSHNS
jgi:hypothetical protein